MGVAGQVSDPISVIIPVYNQREYISGALSSLLKQRHSNFEVIIVDDGSIDRVYEVISRYKQFLTIIYIRNEKNMGLGHALNQGNLIANYNLVAYLPADDLFFPCHLSTLLNKISDSEDAILVYAGMKYNYVDGSTASSSSISFCNPNDPPLQLVQTMHRKTELSWMSRTELTTDNLEMMFWSKLRVLGNFESTSRVSCEWISHPLQRHKLINELIPGGGIFRYKEYFKIDHPIRFKSSHGNFIDEFSMFREAKKNDSIKTYAKKLKILLVGELAYNADRVCELEKHGHQLYGLWIEKPYFYNTIGPLPFGNVINIPRENWVSRVNEIQPDVIYALLNHQAVELAHEVLIQNLGIPFIWHFKESPFYCRSLGLWGKLIDLYQKSDGHIFINEETKAWFSQYISLAESKELILDGDLPSAVYFQGSQTPLLSQQDGEIHTVITGRPFGISLKDIAILREHKVHVHLYGTYNHSAYYNWVAEAMKPNDGYFHLHSNITPELWTTEFSRYDAGWLHACSSSNFGEIVQAVWSDLNYPARMSTLAAAGIPMIQKNNIIHSVATENITRRLGSGVFYNTVDELVSWLQDRPHMTTLRNNSWSTRHEFCFDYHVDQLLDFFYRIIECKK